MGGAVGAVGPEQQANTSGAAPAFQGPRTGGPGASMPMDFGSLKSALNGTPIGGPQVAQTSASQQPTAQTQPSFAQSPYGAGDPSVYTTTSADMGFGRRQVQQPAPQTAQSTAPSATVYQPQFQPQFQQQYQPQFQMPMYMNPYGMYGGFNPYSGGIMGLLGSMGGMGGGYGMGGMGGMGGGGFGGYNPYRFY